MTAYRAALASLVNVFVTYDKSIQYKLTYVIYLGTLVQPTTPNPQ